MTIKKNETALSGMFPEEIQNFCGLKEKFRAQQIFHWIASGVKSFDEMTNISLDMRSKLKKDFSLFSTKIKETLKDKDGTIKLAVELYDGAVIETVLLTDKAKRKTACVSCQAGCPMKCAFCKTGQIGFLRNLSASEIVEQFLHLEREAGTLDNIVFMGMGEPMLNLPEIDKAINILAHPKGRNLSKRRITISTSGLCNGIYEMADKGPEVRLAVSLTTADEILRSELMPINKTNSLDELKQAIKYFNSKSNKRVTLELALMKGLNTDKKAAQQVVEFAKGLECFINLIPWNPVEGLNFKSPSEAEVRNFETYLKKAGLNISTRQKRGQSIGGACGQLGSTAIISNRF